MSHRWIAALALAALLTACRGARGGWVTVPAPAPDPDRWEHAACLAGEYPAPLDARALARARQQDLTARRRGGAGLFATARLERARRDFDVRCAAWRVGGAAPAFTRL